MAKLVFTFDDGIKSHYDRVYPFLRDREVTATFFVPGKRDLWLRQHRGHREHDGADMVEGALEWEEIVEMDAAGFEIGNHTYSHTGVKTVDRISLKAQIDSLEQLFASYGIRPSVTFCYPAYDYNEMACSLLKELKFKFARTGYCFNGEGRKGEPIGGNCPKLRPECRYYIPGETNPFVVPTTGIFNDWYTISNFTEDLNNTPESGVAVFGTHGLRRDSRWESFINMVDYAIDRGHKIINFRDMPLAV